MSHSSRASLLEDEIELLVQHFGLQRVQAALAKFERDGQTPSQVSKAKPRNPKRTQDTVANCLDAIRESAPEKHRLLSEFMDRLKDRRILPESQDIRHFAQLVGLKNIGAKSRKDMLPKLMRFLLEQPVERLRVDLASASNISEEQRQKGFSILTDKLLRNS